MVDCNHLHHPRQFIHVIFLALSWFPCSPQYPWFHIHRVVVQTQDPPNVHWVRYPIPPWGGHIQVALPLIFRFVHIIWQVHRIFDSIPCTSWKIPITSHPYSHTISSASINGWYSHSTLRIRGISQLKRTPTYSVYLSISQDPTSPPYNLTLVVSTWRFLRKYVSPFKMEKYYIMKINVRIILHSSI